MILQAKLEVMSSSEVSKQDEATSTARPGSQGSKEEGTHHSIDSVPDESDIEISDAGVWLMLNV